MSQVISFADYTPPPRFDGIPWANVKIEEASTSSGTWALIDTIALVADPDPANPAARNITTDNASDAPDLWYRLTFVDGSGDVSQPSTPIQNSRAAVQFATSEDLAARLGITLTAAEETRADSLLAMASGLIQEETSQTIERVADETLTVRSTYSDRIRLPQRPVVGVTSVTLTLIGADSGYEVPATDWYVDGDELVRTATPLGLQHAFASYRRGWLGPLYELAVVYTHGFEAIPPVVRSVAIEMAVRAWVNPGAVARESVGDTQTVYDNMRFSPSGLLMTDLERQQVNDAIRRQSTSTTLR